VAVLFVPKISPVLYRLLPVQVWWSLFFVCRLPGTHPEDKAQTALPFVQEVKVMASHVVSASSSPRTVVLKHFALHFSSLLMPEESK
jgi:hypothetical protein